MVQIVASRLQAWPAFTRAQLKIENREVPGQWEGDLIEGAGNPSPVGTLVERSSQYVTLVKLDNATTKEVVERFSDVLNREPGVLLKSMTYDQGREMHGHQLLTEKLA